MSIILQNRNEISTTARLSLCFPKGESNNLTLLQLLYQQYITVPALVFIFILDDGTK